MKQKEKKIQWHAMEIEDAIAKLQSSQNGLSQYQAQKRLKTFGKNKLPQDKSLSKIRLFLKQFQNPLIYILIIIVVIAFFIKHHTDAIFILIVVMINSLVSFIQEYKANKALASLKSIIKPQARILRSDKHFKPIEQEISIEEIVPGDIIILRPGDVVAADARLIEASNLKIDESRLTGEFWPIKKNIIPQKPDLNIADQQNMVWLGTSVEQGQGLAVVTATGCNTQLGILSLLMRETKEDLSPLQKRIKNLARFLAVIIIIITVFLFIIGILRGVELSQIFLMSTALAVSAIPEGLVPAITIVLVIGARRILKRKGLVRRLGATETLGSTTVICVDKTGTLTIGKMTVSQIITDDKNKLFRALSLCNNAVFDLKTNQIKGSATDIALARRARRAGFYKLKLEKKFPRIAHLPFDAEKKYLACLNKIKDQNSFLLFVNGAPEKILSMVNLRAKARQDLEKKIEKMTKQGLRVIATAQKQVPASNGFSPDWNKELHNMKFIGLVGLKDPLRKQAKIAIKTAKRAGVRPVIVSGDHKFTVQKIARDLGFATGAHQVADGLALDKISDEELLEKVRNINVYARVAPEQKLRIINAWQNLDHEVIAMTGDGVNDAPALKKADIGIALGSGTQVAKQAADLVLLKDSFATIIKAIEQGRIIFANIKKVVLYLLANDFSEILLVMFSILLGLPLPLLPAQILWINIIEDLFPSLALTFEKGEDNVMLQKPSHRNLFDKPMKRLLVLIALVTGTVILSLFIILFKIWGLDHLDKIRSIVFATETVVSILFVFVCARLNKPVWSKVFLRNLYLVGSSIFGFLLLIFALYVPFMQSLLKTVSLGLSSWVIIIIVALLNIVLIEVLKARYVNGMRD